MLSVAVLALGASAAVSGAAPTRYERPGRTELVSVSSSGAQANDHSFSGAISRNGRFVVFGSAATNLVPGDVNSIIDVFWRDRATGVIRLASLSSDGRQAVGLPNARSGGARISADGRYVAFLSAAVNLVPGDTNLGMDVFRRDMVSGQIVRVSVGPGGVQSNLGSDAITLSMSADGRYIAFQSNSSNLVAGDTNGHEDIFVRDVKLGRTIRASVSSAGSQANGWSGHPSITPNGRWLVFTSTASNLVPGVDGQQVYRRDLVTGKTIVVSVSSDGSLPSFSIFPSCKIHRVLPVDLPPAVDELGLLSGGLRTPCHTSTWFASSISDDGRYVTFFSTGTNLVPNDTNWVPSGHISPGQDVFVRDVALGRTERVSVDSNGQERANQKYMERGVISGDGRMIGYLTQNPQQCSGLPRAPEDLPYWTDLPIYRCNDSHAYTYDRLSGEMQFASQTPAGKPVSPPPATPPTNPNDLLSLRWGWLWHYPVGFSGDGRYLVIDSNATDFVSNDKNGNFDVFVRDRGSQVGAGGFAANGTLSVAGVPSFNRTGALSASRASGRAVDLVRDAELIGARAVYRAATSDLFVRLDVADMPTVAGAVVPGALYGLRLTANGVRYEVRAQRVLGSDFDVRGGASFGLFRQDSATGQYLKVATLKGGYGTIGESVVAAVPLAELGLTDGGRLSDVTAFTAVGSYTTGAARLLDTIRLAP